MLHFQKKDDRPLPQYRGATEAHEFGFHEVEDVPPGKLTLRTVSQLLLRYKTEEVDLDQLAVEYKVNREVLADVVHYFRLLDFKTLSQLKQDVAKDTLLASAEPTITVEEDSERKAPELDKT